MVVNHHLLCADFALRDDGFGELLPGADAYIIDEAHQLPEVASSFFGTTVSTRQLLELGRDTQTEYHREAGDLPQLLEQIESLAKSARDLRLAFGQSLRRGAWHEIESDAPIVEALDACHGQLRRLGEMLEVVEGRGKGLDACLARCQGLATQLQALVSPPEGSEDIRWFETHVQSLRLNSTPLDVADVFQQQVQRHPAAWIFTSATLAVGDSFEHFQRQLGLADAVTCIWESPFDYPQQALWFVPRGLPQPSDPAYTGAVVDLAEPILEGTGQPAPTTPVASPTDESSEADAGGDADRGAAEPDAEADEELGGGHLSAERADAAEDRELALAACGDWCAGPRVEGAAMSGWSAAATLSALLAQ